MTDRPAELRPNEVVQLGGDDTPCQAALGNASKIIDAARETSAQRVNPDLTAAYRLIGHRIVRVEQAGEEWAEYGAALVERLAKDLEGRIGRGFPLQNIRLFYPSYVTNSIRQTPSGDSASSAGSVEFNDQHEAFPRPWATCVQPPSVRYEQARWFYETEALRGGLSARLQDRQLNFQFRERTALYRDGAAMLLGKALLAAAPDRTRQTLELRASLAPGGNPAGDSPQR